VLQGRELQRFIFTFVPYQEVVTQQRKPCLLSAVIIFIYHREPSVPSFLNGLSAF